MKRFFLLTVSALYTMGLAVVIMVPLRYVLNMYRWQWRRKQGGELL